MGMSYTHGRLIGALLIPIVWGCLALNNHYSTKEEPVEPIKEPTKIERMFEQYDSNRDGFLDRNELTILLEDSLFKTQKDTKK